MDKIDRIIVTGDIFRLNASGAESQNVNIRWLYHVVRPALGMVCGLPVDPLLHLPGSPWSLQYTGRTISLSGWKAGFAYTAGIPVRANSR